MKKTVNRICAFLIAWMVFLPAWDALAEYSLLIDEHTVGNYLIHIHGDYMGSAELLRIYKDDRLVYQEKDYRFRIGLMEGDIPGNEAVAPGADITGDGTPNLVVSSWSGGAHCCFAFRVFSLGEVFRLVHVFGVSDVSNSRFKDLDNDGKLEFITSDMTFAYWNASFAQSPAPEVILRYQDGRYVLAWDLMDKPPSDKPDEAFLINDEDEKTRLCSQDIWSWRKNGVCVTSEVWGHMLDLIYTGHSKEAFAFLDRIWEGDENTKQWFIYDFKRRLASSPYAHELPVDLFSYGAVATDRMSDDLQNIEMLRKEMPKEDKDDKEKDL